MLCNVPAFGDPLVVQGDVGDHAKPMNIINNVIEAV